MRRWGLLAVTVATLTAGCSSQPSLWDDKRDAPPRDPDLAFVSDIKSCTGIPRQGDCLYEVKDLDNYDSLIAAGHAACAVLAAHPGPSGDPLAHAVVTQRGFSDFAATIIVKEAGDRLCHKSRYGVDPFHTGI